MVGFPEQVRQSTIRQLTTVLFFFIVLVIVLLFVLAAVPQLAGADESYVVLSDSMSPTIEAGAVVFVSDVPAEQVQEGDVITFRTGNGQSTPVTHRVVDVRTAGGQRSFVTKGDANEDSDPSPVAASAVVGKVGFHVPLIGYVVSFASSKLGLLSLVIVPAGALVALELRDLWHAAKDDESDDAGEDEGR